MTEALVGMRRISPPEKKTEAEKIVGARQQLVLMKSAPLHKLNEMLDAAIAELG